MSQQVDEIFAKYKKVFITDQENIKNYLLTHYERAFKTRQVLNVERIDNTERIKISGFSKYLSSWRNFYQNIVVTSCVLINNIEKRYDYKFYFTKEKLDDATIEKIERALEESARLRRNFKFDEAIAIIDDMLELIQKKKDDVTNKILNNARKEIVEAQEKHDKNMMAISKLENKIKVAEDYDNLRDIPKNCDNIIKLAESVGRKDVVNKYKGLKDETQREIEQRKAKEKQMALSESKALTKRKEQESYDKAMAQIANLEEKIKKDRANGNLKAAILDCEKIINIANLIDKDDLIVKYSKLYENLNNELEAQEAREREMAIKSKEALKKQKAEKKRKALEAKEAAKRQKAERKRKALEAKEAAKRQKSEEKKKAIEAKETLKKQKEEEKRKALEAEEELKKQKELEAEEKRKALEAEETLKRQKELEAEEKRKAMEAEEALKRQKELEAEEKRKAMEAEEALKRQKELEAEEKRKALEAEEALKRQKELEAEEKRKALEAEEALKRQKELEAEEKRKALEDEKTLKAQQEKEQENKILEQIAILEESVRKNQEEDNLDAVIRDCKQIISLANSIDRGDIADKYRKIMDDTLKLLEKRKAEEKQKALEAKEAAKRQKAEEKQKASEAKKALKEQKRQEKEKSRKEKEALKEQQILEEIAVLEENIRINQERDNLNTVVSDSRQIIKLANSIAREDITEKYSKILDDTQTEIEKRKAEEILRAISVKETVDSRLIYKEVITNKFLIILCIIGGILIITHAILNIVLLITTIYTNIVVDIRILNIRLETRETFFIFLLINACICILSGSLVIIGSIGLFSNKILFGRAMIIYGIFIALMGAPSLLIVGIWAGSLSGNFAGYIMIYVFIYFIICLVGVVFIDFALWRIRTERIKVPRIQKFTIKKRIITQKKIGKQGTTYTVL